MIYNFPYNLDDLQDTVNKTVKRLTEHISEFDSIVVRGNSGILVGAPVSLLINKPIVVIRKGSEKSHDHNPVININSLGRRWLFLDDIIDSGKTLKTCKSQITKNAWNTSWVGSYLYSHDSWMPAE